MEQVSKAMRVKYREAAAALYRTTVPETAHVQPMHDGAFVEIVVWIPRETVQSPVVEIVAGVNVVVDLSLPDDDIPF